MIRFRTHEDERRYNALMTEAYLRLAQALGATRPELVGEILRNFAKVQQFVYTEGIRQGAIAAVLNDLDDPRGFSGTALHHRFYGEADTPLSKVEQAFKENLAILDGRWAAWDLVATEPIEFAPTTLAEAEAAMAGRLPPPVAPVGRGQNQTPREKYVAEPALGAPLLLDAEPETPEETIERLAIGLGVDPATLEEEPVVEAGRGDDGYLPVPQHVPPPPEMPAKLEAIREALVAMLQTGWKPTSYEDVIKGLYLRLLWDAAFLDMLLATPIGRTVLDQCGLINIGVPTEMDARFLQEPP